MMRWTLMLGLGLWSSAALSQECDDYGQLRPDETDAYSGSEITFRISQANNESCGDVSLCEWSLPEDFDGIYGSLDAETGSPVVWTAPETIEDCSGYSFNIYAQCADAAEVGSARVTLYCDEDDKDAIQAQSRNTTVEGGGCGSAADIAGVFFLPLALLGWRRR
jgi:hypothetical protein